MAGMAGFGWAADTMGPHVSLLGIGFVLLCTACIAALSCRRFRPVPNDEAVEKLAA
jgi:MFS transporter, DHA3 family, macrolide efflux protein